MTSYACDTSVAVAAVDPNHVAHRSCRAALVAHRPVLAGHAAFETVAVLTRLPAPFRVSPREANAAIAAFGDPAWLNKSQQSAALAAIAEANVAGGATYDALVGAAANAHGHTLLTRDRRAVRTYGAMGVTYELVVD